MVNNGFNYILSNTVYVPSPHVGGNHSVHEREGFYFAEDSYLIWPQPHNTMLPHLPFIHSCRIEMDQKDRAFLWCLPDRGNFQSNDTLCTGIGRIHNHLLAPFHCFRNTIIQRIKSYNDTYTDRYTLTDQEKHMLSSLLTNIVPILNRLEFASTSFSNICHIFRALQRTLLESEAFADYIECRTQNINTTEAVSMLQTDDGKATTDMPVLQSVGTFVYSHDQVAQCKMMGINH